MKTGENGIISVNLSKIYVIFLLVKDPELEKKHALNLPCITQLLNKLFTIKTQLSLKLTCYRCLNLQLKLSQIQYYLSLSFE